MPETTLTPPVPVLTGERNRGIIRKLRPPALRWVIVALVIFDVVGRFMPHKPTHLSTLHMLSAFIFVISTLIEAACYTFFWKGRNWARILILVGCVVELLGLAFIRGYRAPTQVYNVVHLVFSAVLFYWLMRKPVIAFFKAPGEATSNSDDIALAHASPSL